MKRRIFISLLLAFVMSLVLSVPVLAGEPWDVEDPEVANNEDFIWGQGWDGGYPDGALESYYGEQSWSYFPTPNDDYNLYRDDVTDTGNLDAIQSIVTRTPDVIDLPDATTQYFNMDGGFYYMTSENPDTWYWAIEPRGYNLPSITRTPDIDLFDAGQFDVVIGTWDSYETYKWEGGYLDGKVLGEDISQVGKCNGGYYRLDIPKGTEITCYGMRVDGVKLWISQDGTIQFTMGRNMQFSNECTISVLTEAGWEVVATFTEIYRGVPR